MMAAEGPAAITETLTDLSMGRRRTYRALLLEYRRTSRLTLCTAASIPTLMRAQLIELIGLLSCRSSFQFSFVTLQSICMLAVGTKRTPHLPILLKIKRRFR
jgi:hypothetical protein